MATIFADHIWNVTGVCSQEPNWQYVRLVLIMVWRLTAYSYCGFSKGPFHRQFRRCWQYGQHIRLMSHERYCVSKRQQPGCLFNSLFGPAKMNYKSSVLLACLEGNPPEQNNSNAGSVSLLWQHLCCCKARVLLLQFDIVCGFTWMSDLVSTITIAGSIIGAVGSGAVSDRWDSEETLYFIESKCVRAYLCA